MRASYNTPNILPTKRTIVPDMKMRASYNALIIARLALPIVPDMKMRASYNTSNCFQTSGSIVADMKMRATCNAFVGGREGKLPSTALGTGRAGFTRGELRSSV